MTITIITKTILLHPQVDSIFTGSMPSPFFCQWLPMMELLVFVVLH